MRAFLREPSTPWIVFDREGRPQSQLAVGEVLPVALTSVIPDHGFFPATAIIDAAAAASKAEPSSLAVVSDLEQEDGSAEANALDAGAVPVPMRGPRLRGLGLAASSLAVLAFLGIGVMALRSPSSHDLHSARSAALASPRTFGAPVPADIPPPDLDLAMTDSATESAASSAAPERVEPARSGPKKLGKLSIRGEARWRDVYMDGKRLLGHGARSFTVFCGTHSISINSRTGGREVDVPCNAELVVSK